MNSPSTKSMFSTGHSMSQCQQNSVMCSECNHSRFLRFISKKEAFAQELPFLKNVLKLSILPIESVFIFEFHVGLKVKIAEYLSKNCLEHHGYHVNLTKPNLKVMSNDHRGTILNRGSMFAFQWREFSLPLSSAHRLFQCYHRQKRDRRSCNSRGIPRL